LIEVNRGTKSALPSQARARSAQRRPAPKRGKPPALAGAKNGGGRTDVAMAASSHSPRRKERDHILVCRDFHQQQPQNCAFCFVATHTGGHAFVEASTHPKINREA
jgi:hypothetical protein